MKKYTFCPICGHKLSKSSSCKDLELTCPYCGQYVNVIIDEHQMIICDRDPVKPSKAIRETREHIFAESIIEQNDVLTN